MPAAAPALVEKNDAVYLRIVKAPVAARAPSALRMRGPFSTVVATVQGGTGAGECRAAR